MSRENGYFENYINRNTATTSTRDGALLATVSGVTARTIERAEVRWAGSQLKSTDIVGSDIDLCVVSVAPVSAAQRRALWEALFRATGRAGRVLSHAIRLDGTAGLPKVDIAFANAEFGSRAMPDATEFSGFPKRQMVARAVKLWTRAGGLPRLSGWAVEAMIVAHDASPQVSDTPLAFFDRVVDWYAATPTVATIERVLRPRAQPWRDEWLRRLPGQLEAVSNAARSLASRRSARAAWVSSDDVGRWLGR
jgi:hypothetical protein